MTDPAHRLPTRRMVGGGALALLATGTAHAAPRREQIVYVGTQATDAGQGIVAARLDARTGTLTPIDVVAEIARPTWVLAHPKRPALYAVSETGNDGKTEGKVYALRADAETGALTTISTVNSGGGGPTHLGLADGGLLVANYGTGHVAALPIRADDGLEAAASVQANQGSGPSPRQKGPHAHGVALDPSGQFVLAADLGADRLFVHPYNRAARRLGPASEQSAALPPGTGPRHLVFHPKGRFVFLISELIPQVRTYGWDAKTGRLTLAHTTPVLSEVPKASGAEIAISRDGRFVYASLRVENVIVVFAVDPRTGALTVIQRVASGGQTPWSFGIDQTGRWLLAANQGSNTVTVLARDPADGRLAPTDQSLAVGKPTSLAFLAAR
ncbi:lactonase family protein [Caulobacter hibisci]|uniref:Lactonase family protein n=1 Tax=Caulobacter hibisci TaxID=2035993 RepID=A0ABS0SZK8_9CAUL|nr:lactonase family protein [Caulobacter hibisci]MBI1684300.1 lactonase family protein [Caulobacter hibisci]